MLLFFFYSDQLISNLSVEEEVFGGMRDRNEELDEHEDSQGDDVKQAIAACVDDQKGIVWVSQLIQLIKLLNGDICKEKGCCREMAYKTCFVGTGLSISWSCQQGHGCGKWHSQPFFKKMYAGNLLMAAGVLLSGNSCLKMKHFCNTVGLASISQDTFYRVQKRYVAPVADTYWTKMQESILGSYGTDDVILAGDGRCDSPGHSAQYCSYVLTDESQKKVLHVETVDVRQAAGKSPNMEKIGFERGLDFLMSRIYG